MKRDDVSLVFVYLELSRHECLIENYGTKFVDICGC